MPEKTLVEMELGPEARAHLEEFQEYFARAGLDKFTCMLICSELHAWMTLVCMDDLGLQPVLDQLDRSHEAAIAWVKGNFEALQARRAVLRDLDKGESGGRMQ